MISSQGHGPQFSSDAPPPLHPDFCTPRLAWRRFEMSKNVTNSHHCLCFTYEKGEVATFLSPAARHEGILNRSGQLHVPSAITLGKQLRSLLQRLCGFQIRSGRFRGESDQETILPAGNRTPIPVARSLGINTTNGLPIVIIAHFGRERAPFSGTTRSARRRS